MRLPLLLSLLLQQALAYIEVISTDERYPDRTADFGPLFPVTGMSGYLIPVEFLQEDDQWGCEPIDAEKLETSPIFQALLSVNKSNPETPLPWIALVERGKCPFIDKVRAMQASGAMAVVIGDNQKGSLLKMYASGDTSDIIVPSAFIMQYEYRDLKYQAMERIASALRIFQSGKLSMNDDNHHNNNNNNDHDDILGKKKKSIHGKERNYFPVATKSSRYYKKEQKNIPALAIRIFPDEFTDWPVLDLLSVILLGPIIICLGLYSLWRCRDGDDEEAELFIRRNIRDTPAPQYMVNNLPRKRFKKEEMAENDHDVCAICLEDFEEDEELRVLPCKHDFHIECIDQWLLTRKRYCPVCKADACPLEVGPAPVLVPLLPGSDADNRPWDPPIDYDRHHHNGSNNSDNHNAVLEIMPFLRVGAAGASSASYHQHDNTDHGDENSPANQPFVASFFGGNEGEGHI